jgi:hypothetical protein
MLSIAYYVLEPPGHVDCWHTQHFLVYLFLWIYFISLIIPERLNTSISKLAELHRSLLLNNMNVVKYVKQLQCHLAEVKHEFKNNSEL